MNFGNTDKIFSEALKNYFKDTYQDTTDQDYANFARILSEAQSGDNADVINAFFTKENLLYTGYLEQLEFSEKALAIQSVIESVTALGFGIAKGVAMFAPRRVPAVSISKPLVDNPFDGAGKLKPNVKYKAGEHQYDYETDGLGRISRFETNNLQLTSRGNRLDHNPNTPGKQQGDHAGHLAGDRFGGSPELDNLVSQSSNVNLSQYKKIENQWANAINEGKQEKVNVEVNYDGDSLRPSKFIVQYEIDGEVFSKNLLN
jgi:hypothetical protein